MPLHTSTVRDSSARCRAPLLAKAAGSVRRYPALSTAIGHRRGSEDGHIFGSRPVTCAGQPPFLQRLLRVLPHMTGAVAEHKVLATDKGSVLDMQGWAKANKRINLIKQERRAR
jgi:hypothetical protein